VALQILSSLKKPAVSIKHLLHQKLAGYDEPRPHFPLRASDLLSTRGEFCPREHSLLDLGHGTKKGMFVGTSLRYTFDHGKDTEKRIRNQYLRHIAVGQWRCIVCNYLQTNFTKAPTTKCPQCKYERWEYEEPTFSSPYSGIQGHIDMCAEVGQPKLKLIELKTMAPDEFKSLIAPLAEHRARTSLYLDLAAESTWLPSDRVNTNEAVILYASKAFGIKDDSLKAAGIKDAAFSPFKEFTIKRDPDINKTAVGKARVLKQWREDKKGMPCGVCANGLTKRAQGCATVGACFSGKFQSTLTWLVDGQPKHPGKTIVQ
jgi:hypothetical protein